MESNGVPRDRMLAINFTDPLARTDDKVAQPNRSSTEDQRRELGEAIKELKRRTGAARVALVGNSRGGNPIRSYIKNGGGADVSHAVLCGVPNHGVYDWEQNARQRVQRPRSVPARVERRRQRGDAGHRVPDAAQRRHRQICASRWPLRRQAGHADRRHRGRPGAEGRHQSRARRDRSSRDGVSSARVPRDLQIHRRPRAGPDRDCAGSGGQTERPGHGHAGRRANQPPGGGRDGRSASRIARHRRAPGRPDPFVANRRGRALGAGEGRSRPGTSRSCSPQPVRPPRISTVRRFRALPTSCICAPRGRWDRPTRAPARSC